MKAERLRRFIDLHASVGMVSGLLLFVAFFAGAINVFHHELHHWQALPSSSSAPHDADRFLERLTGHFPQAAERFYFLPGEDPGAMWKQDGEWRTAHASSFTGEGTFSVLPESGLADFINELHYQLAIPGGAGLLNIGMTLMGLVAVLYGVALFSGLLIHWPKLGKELLALRHQGNLRRYWKNLHNLIGVISLPFHLIMAVTGAAMGLFTVMAVLLGALVFGPQLQDVIAQETDVWPPMERAGEPVAMALMADYLSAAEHAVPGLQVAWVEVRGYGDSQGWLGVAGSVPGNLGHHAHVVLDPELKPLRVISPQQRNLNYASLSPVYSLHFGDYGGLPVKLMYFLLGLLGCLLFVSGNILWCERRSDRTGPSRASAFLLRLTLGVCVGVVSGVAVSFWVSKLGLHSPWADQVQLLERLAFVLVLLPLVLWSLRASPLRYCGLGMRIMPWLYLAIPVLSVLLEGSRAWREGDVLLVNLLMLSLAGLLWLVRIHFRRRVRLAEPHPLWVGRVSETHPLKAADAES
ncbi:PepSY domain-containing protein [Alcanivorax sp. DP30]|uniref:PepSY-associated TM helix domain-containing protein n=1 Tax=Alcanivorax sp. DP30 TaxID=2606217 RepID=UPI0013720B4C|nr:PepSY-associated TM helix domain-containing protein [Alcanivorax sp. DP30]MZR62819.1 PepSY domain-containing protein [Alcanivorax sp. DP30]